MKVLIDFTNVFTAFCKISENENKQIEIQEGQYLVEVEEGKESFLVSHPTFFFQVPREEWKRGRFFIQNQISLRYLEEVEFADQ